MKTLLKTTLILFLVAGAFLLQAQTPNSFSYQTVIRDNSGNPLANQAVRLKISILKSESNGTVVYAETHQKTTNDFGLVNLYIGDGSVLSGNFSNINWGNDLYFVKTELDASGGTNFTTMGTQQLLSVPYALHAKTVEIDNVNDADANPTNEIQSLSFNNSTGQLSISNGNTITLPTTSGGDNWGTQTVQHNATLSGNGTTTSPLQVVGDLTDDQTLALNGTTLSIANGNSVNLSAIDTDTDNQTLALNGNSLSISNGNSINLNSIDNQTLSISGNTLSINNGNSVTLPTTSGGDNWGTQSVQHNTTLSGNGTTASPLQVVGDLTDNQTLALNGTTLSIANGNSVNLSAIDTDTDNQTLALTGNTLSISSGNSVTLPSSNNSWSLTGNTVDTAINFIGSTNNAPIKFKINNNWAGQWDATKANYFIGRSGTKITSGQGNIGIGNYNLNINELTGNDNIAFGRYSAYYNASGSRNIAIGKNAIWRNTNGSGNIAIGANTFNNGFNLNGCIAIGDSAGYNFNALDKSIFIGNKAGKNVTTGNLLYIENSDSDEPLIWGDFLVNKVKIYGQLGIKDEYVFPVIDGQNTQILQANGNGQLSWKYPNQVFADDQTLLLNGNTLSISDGNNVNLNAVDNQTLSVSGSSLSIDNGNSVNIGFGAKAYGTVNANGSIVTAKSSTNFTVSKLATGLYTISSTSIDFSTSTILVTSGYIDKFISAGTGTNNAAVAIKSTTNYSDAAFSFVIF